MANITFTVQSLVNTAVYDSYTIDNGQTVDQLKTAINTARGYDSAWYDIVFGDAILSGSATLAASGIVAGSAVRTHNKIAHLDTREQRQKAKLDLAQIDRAYSSNPRSTVDLTTLPTLFDDDDIVDNPNIGGLVAGRPWIETVSTFTFYEAINTTTALSTTQYVKGNKIYAYSSSYDVPGFQPARVVVNGVEVLNTELRGHTMVVLNNDGDVEASYRFDTYIDPANVTAMATALGAVAAGNIVVLVVYDASAFNSACRSALTSGYGNTNSNTWTAGRYDHIFIGVKQ
jgi:hypothetical protein